MRIRSTGIIDGRTVHVNWANGKFESTVESTGDVALDRYLDRLVAQGTHLTFDAFDSVDSPAFVLALHIIFEKIYDRRLSVSVEYNDGTDGEVHHLGPE